MMKKNVRVIIATVAALLAATMAFTGCSKKETSAWTTDYEAAKKTAAKKGKNIFLLFSGDDWDGTSKTFKDAVANTDEFVSTMSKDYVLVNLDFSQTEYATTNIDESTATKKEKKAADAMKAKYEEKERVAQMYNVESYPAVYITTPEGYVIANIPYDETIKTTADYTAKIAEKSADIEKVTALVKAVVNAKKTDRVKAIDALYEAAEPNYRSLLGDLMREVPTLDKNNETGLVGKYEMQTAYLDAVEKARKMDTDGAVQVFLDVCDKGHLENSEKQEAYYTAAYILAASGGTDYDRMIELLQKAYDIDPTNEHAQEITGTIAAVKEMKEKAAATAATAPAKEPVPDEVVDFGADETAPKADKK